MLATDEAIDHGADPFPQTAEQKKASKEARSTGTRTYTFTKRERKPDEDKRELINLLLYALDFCETYPFSMFMPSFCSNTTPCLFIFIAIVLASIFQVAPFFCSSFLFISAITLFSIFSIFYLFYSFIIISQCLNSKALQYYNSKRRIKRQEKNVVLFTTMLMLI